MIVCHCVIWIFVHQENDYTKYAKYRGYDGTLQFWRIERALGITEHNVSNTFGANSAPKVQALQREQSHVISCPPCHEIACRVAASTIGYIDRVL